VVHTDVSVTGASAHNTATATTIEEAVAFYDSPAFNNSPSGRAAPIDLTATEIDNIGRFLRGVNATFNIAMSLRRLDAAARLIERFHSNELRTQREMLRLANAEIIDAIDVLAGAPELNANALFNLRSARTLVDQARATNSDSERAATIRLARTQLQQATPKIGSNLTYQIGEGTLMF
jgi:hypothetical protein